MKLDVIKLAREAGWSGLFIEWAEPTGEPDWSPYKTSLTVPATQEQINRFAALVIEECAKECDAIETNEWQSYKKTYDKHVEGMSDGATECAAAIRELKEPECSSHDPN